MAYSNFKKTVWSNHIQRALEKACVLVEDCNREFEGEAKNGARVKILGVTRPTIGTYAGTDIGAPEEVARTIRCLCESDTSFVTGQVIGVTGGFMI